MTRILLVGYGNIGKAAFSLLPQYPDLELMGIVTRRPETVRQEVGDVPVYRLDDPKSYLHCRADVAILCGGSKEDLPKQTPYFARHFNVVDSFDTHGHIGSYIEEGTGQPMLGHLETVDLICRAAKHAGHIGIGWDPGSFSMMRAYFAACLVGGCKAHAFYGLTPRGGLSMGHTNAIKRIPGVRDALQFTHAKQEVINNIRQGDMTDFSDHDKHWRECLVVPEEGADVKEIMNSITGMPLYFKPYSVVVKFVPQKELDAMKDGQPHDGLVIIRGPAGYMEFRNVWHSNPLGTAGFLLAYARATHRAHTEGRYGCFTVLDSPVADLLPQSFSPITLV